MVSVTAKKVREAAKLGQGRSSSRVYTGFLISYPLVGRGMVIFRDPHGHRMITTPVRRVLGSPGEGDRVLYVETENSVYRLTFHEPMVAAPALEDTPVGQEAGGTRPG